MLINENRWRAMRYSYDEGLIDLARGEVISYTELLTEICELVEEDAGSLGCEQELENVRRILLDGTSAHNQLRVYNDALSRGESEVSALQGVVDWLIEQTVKDL